MEQNSQITAIGKLILSEADKLTKDDWYINKEANKQLKDIYFNIDYLVTNLKVLINEIEDV